MKLYIIKFFTAYFEKKLKRTEWIRLQTLNLLIFVIMLWSIILHTTTLVFIYLLSIETILTAYNYLNKISVSFFLFSIMFHITINIFVINNLSMLFYG